MKTNWHVATAAEAIVAGQFARLGFNVSVQYGANQPEYDLMVEDEGQALKVSVKGSQDGSWGLTQSFLKKAGPANYHGAIDLWLQRHKLGTVLCLVQFQGVPTDAMPRIYLAGPKEIADLLRAASGGRGDTILFEEKTRGPKAAGAGTIERVPPEWKLTAERIAELLAK